MSGVPFDADGLRAAGRDLAVPFQVQLADGRLLQMQRLLRLLPGKRIAGGGIAGGRRCSPSSLWRRPVSAIGWRVQGRGGACRRRHPTPEVLLADRLRGGGHLIVSSYVEEAESLAADWARLDAPPAEIRAPWTFWPPCWRCWRRCIARVLRSAISISATSCVPAIACW